MEIKSLGFEISRLGLSWLESIFTDNIDYQSAELKTLFKNFSVNEEQYSNFTNQFSLGGKTEKASAEELVDHVVSTLDLELSNQEKGFLVGMFAVLPEDLRQIRKRGEATSSVLDNINLLPLIRKGLAAIQANPDNKNKEKIAELGEKLSEKITDSYVEIEQTRLSADPAAQNELLNMTEDERRAAVEDVINASNVSPIARASNQNIAEPEAISGTPTMDSNLPTAFQKTLPSTGMDIQTYEDFIKINPGTTIVDLAKLEATGEWPFNDSFEASFFRKWMPEAGDVVSINNFTTPDAAERAVAGQQKPAPKTVKWNAYQALDFIYGLEESNNREGIAEIQSIMRQAGYYQGRAVDDSVVMPAFRPGYLDDATIEAWQLFLTDAARKNLSPSRLLFEQKQSRYNQRLTGEGIPQIDPFERDATVQQFAMNVLGRALNDEETKKVLQYVMQLERESATLGVMESDPDSINFSARITDFIRRSNEDEARLIYADEQKKAWEGLFGT